MSIKNFFEKSKCKLDENEDLFIMIIIVLTAFGSFGLGRLSSFDSERIKQSVVIRQSANVSNHKTTDNLGGYYIGSKNGSKYHFPWCSGAGRIKEENKVVFSTKEDAKKAGYSPAKNCKGL